MSQVSKSDISAARERLHSAYETSSFKKSARELADSMGDYLERAYHSDHSLHWSPPEVLIEKARALLDAPPDASVTDRFRLLVAECLKEAHQLHSPHYMGHQTAVTVPHSGLFDGMSLVTNQGGGLYEMSPFTTAIERAVVEKLGAQIGWSAGSFYGIGTHGGTLANLTAILAARNRHFPDSWEKGVGHSPAHSMKRPAMATSEDAHYSVARAAGILGLGTDQVILVKVDERRRMVPKSLIEELNRAQSRGLEVFCIVGSACSTPIGAFDPLEELADIAAARKVWLHVDGAHGASVLFSARHRHLVKGIERADSVAWDAHKMLFVPSLATFLLYRNAADSYKAFHQEATYLFDPEAPSLAAYDGAIRTFECTKRAVATGLWGIWSMYGSGLFADLIDVTFDTTHRFYEMLATAKDFEPLHEPQCNILCFRYLPETAREMSAEALSRFQQALRRRIVEKGPFYITSTRLNGGMVLRVTLMNPLTDDNHLEELLESLRLHGGALLREQVW